MHYVETGGMKYIKSKDSGESLGGWGTDELRRLRYTCVQPRETIQEDRWGRVSGGPGPVHPFERPHYGPPLHSLLNGAIMKAVRANEVNNKVGGQTLSWGR